MTIILKDNTPIIKKKKRGYVNSNRIHNLYKYRVGTEINQNMD